MTKFNFLGLWVVTQQHAPLDIIEAYLKNNHIFISCMDLRLNVYNFERLKTRKSESVYF